MDQMIMKRLCVSLFSILMHSTIGEKDLTLPSNYELSLKLRK